jgi:cytohesin
MSNTNPDEELLQACHKGQVKRAARAIENGAHPNTSSDEFGFTPLMSAARQGNLELVELLIDAGAVVKARSSHGVTALQMADCSTPDVFDALLAAGADIRSASLTNIARSGNVDLLSRVLEAGVAVDPPGGNKASALMTASQYRHLELVKLLVNTHGADVNYSYGRQTPLSNAAHAGDAEMVRFLLSAGARPEAGEVSALHNAASSGDPEMVRLLLDAGADVNRTGYLGRTPLIEAQHLRDADAAIETARLLIRAGADVNRADQEGSTPLHFAARLRQVQLAELILESGADLGIGDGEGLTPLELALSAPPLEADRQRHRRPTRAAADDYYEISALLLDHERTSGRLTVERLARITPIAEKHRCPELARQVSALGAHTTPDGDAS